MVRSHTDDVGRVSPQNVETLCLHLLLDLARPPVLPSLLQNAEMYLKPHATKPRVTEEAPHSVKHSPFMPFHVNLDHIREQTWMLRYERFGRPDFHHPAPSAGSFSACPQAIGRRQRIVSWLHERHPIVRSQCSFTGVTWLQPLHRRTNSS